MVAQTFIVRGQKQVQAELKRLGRKANKALARALFIEGELVMSGAKKLVPVDTGALRSTGHVNIPLARAGVVLVTLGFGGPAAPYAIRVHEDLEARHEPPTQAKYLEIPALAAQAGMARRMASRLRAELR